MAHDFTSSYAIRSIAMKIPGCGRPSSSRAIFAVGIQPVRVDGFDGRAGLVARLRAGMCIGAQQAHRRRADGGGHIGVGQAMVDLLGHAPPGTMPPFIPATRAPSTMTSAGAMRHAHAGDEGKARHGRHHDSLGSQACTKFFMVAAISATCLSKNGGTQGAPKNKATSDSLAHSMSGLNMHARPRADAAQVGGRSGILYHQTSYCTPTSVREVLPLAPKLPAFAMAAAWFQLALVTYRRSSGRDQKSSDKARQPASVRLFRHWPLSAHLRLLVDSSARALTFFVNAYAPRPPSVKSLVVTLVRSTLPVW